MELNTSIGNRELIDVEKEDSATKGERKRIFVNKGERRTKTRILLSVYRRLIDIKSGWVYTVQAGTGTHPMHTCVSAIRPTKKRAILIFEMGSMSTCHYVIHERT